MALSSGPARLSSERAGERHAEGGVRMLFVDAAYLAEYRQNQNVLSVSMEPGKKSLTVRTRARKDSTMAKPFQATRLSRIVNGINAALLRLGIKMGNVI